MAFAGAPTVLQISGKLSEVIFHGGWVGNGILLTLTVLSVISWTIMIEKARFFRISRGETRRFLDLFRKEHSLKALAGHTSSFPSSPEAALAAKLASELETGEVRSAAALDRIIETEITAVMAGYESYMQFLATTASISPLLGLFGTVWGIMSAFLSMGAQGSASLFVVGPGIAVALITTIFGLGAAIPAVVGYNFILRTNRGREDEIAAFAGRLRNRIIERVYDELRGAEGAATGAGSAPGGGAA